LNERYSLVRDHGRLVLRDAHAPSGVFVSLDVADVRRRIRQGRRLAVAKACGVRRGLCVLDAMAGFGLDGITLAALGCRVLMVERDPLLYALLEDAVARAGAELQLGSIECRRGDVREVLGTPNAFDTIYLDPMFPERSSSALPRMSAQLLADYVGPPDHDLAGLIAQSCGAARQRVVVKRRRLDPAVASPDWQIVGRSVRFDVYRGSSPSADPVSVDSV
jgi:16S rRNA (guanine1516-N2)-methyltransferase